MKFTSKCPGCGNANTFDREQVGKPAKCAGCGKTLTVPRPQEGAEGTAPAAGTVRFQCPACGRKYATKAELAGKKVKCSGCGAGVRVPEAGSKDPAAPASKRSLKSFDGPSAPGRPPAPAAAPPPAAPKAGPDPARAKWAESEDDDGNPYALAEEPEAVPDSREQMVEMARQKAIAAGKIAATDEPEASGKPKTKKKKRKKAGGFFDPKETLKLVAGVSAVVAVLAFIAWRSPEFRFPLGGVLCVTGFIVYLLGAVSIRQLVAEEGTFNLLLYRFFPPYQWWFVLSRWSDTRDYFAFFASGLVILALGGVILKLSPQGQLAEKSHQAFLKATEGGADAEDDEAPPPATTPAASAPASRRGRGDD